MKEKVVVTGASGHIGYNVARRLCDHGFPVDLLVRGTNANVVDLVERGATHHVVDLANPESYSAILEGTSCLFHLAAENTTALSAAERVLDSTVGLTTTVLNAAADCGVETVVYTSSVVVLGRSNDPQRLRSEADRTTIWESPYVKGKAEADRLCDRLVSERGLDIRRVYPSWVVGPGDLRGTPPHELISSFLQKGQPFFFGGGISIADVEEVARGHVQAWLSGKARESYVLGGDNITFREFYNLLAEISHLARPRIRLPKWFVVVAAAILKTAMRPLGMDPPLDPGYARAVVGSYSWYDSSKAVRELGYHIPDAKASLGRAVLGERKRLAGTHLLGRRRCLSPVPMSRGEAEEMPPLLITGVPGWLGNRFVDVLIRGELRGWRLPRRKVRVLVEPNNADLLDLPDGFEAAPADICDPDAVGAALDGISTIFHLAGAIYPPRIATLYRVNAEGTRNLVDQCIRRGVRRILYMGTDSICGYGSTEQRVFDEHTPDQPYRHYGRSKWMAERYLLEKTQAGLIDGTSLRGFWFFGPFSPPRQKEFLDMMHWRRQVVFGDGANYRSISHLDNTVAAFFAAETAPATYGKWYWVGDLKPDYTVNMIFSLLCDGVGNSFRPLYVPKAVCGVMRLVDALMGKLGVLHPTIHGIGKFNFDIAGRIDAAQRDFAYAPVVSLEEYARTYGSDDCAP